MLKVKEKLFLLFVTDLLWENTRGQVVHNVDEPSQFFLPYPLYTIKFFLQERIIDFMLIESIYVIIL